ncbi:hypothetical protein C2U70_27150 [Bradyrhizobium guangdongense]|nr:hypothetical protein C2U70_27150 [Bradyrhizobium guangdongense]
MLHQSVALHGLILIASATLIATALDRRAECGIVVRLFRGLGLAAIFPLAWMTLQLVPLPAHSFSSSIWLAVGNAFNESKPLGHASVDLGTTLRSTLWYLTNVALFISTVLIARDRTRAETLLEVLSLVASAVAAAALLRQSGHFSLLDPFAGFDSSIAIFSLLVAIAVFLLIFERTMSRSKQNSPVVSATNLRRGLLGLFGSATAIALMVASTPPGTVSIATLGVLVFLFVLIARLTKLGAWTATIIGTALAVIGATLILIQLQPLPWFETQLPDVLSESSSIGLARRVLADSTWHGSGVGTYDVIASLYRHPGDVSPSIPLTSAVSLVTEWGTLGFALMLALAAQIFCFFVHGATARGRDWSFPTLAAAMILTFACEAFFDAGLVNANVQILMAVAAGLGVSQSFTTSATFGDAAAP